MVDQVKFRRAIVTMILGRTSAQVITVLGIVFLARIYSPTDFGVFATIVGIATIFGNIASLRYDLSVLMARSSAGARFATVLALGISVVSISVMAFILIIFSIIGLINPFYVLALVLMTSGIAVINISGLTQSRNRRYLRQAIIGLGRPSGILVFGVIFHFLPIFGNGLIAASACSLFLIAVSLLAIEYRQYPWMALVNKKRGRRLWMARYHELPKYSAPAVLLNTAAASAQPILLFWLFGPVVAGLFSMVTRVVGMPTTLISRSVNIVYQREVAERKNYARAILPLTSKVFFITLICSIGFLLALLAVVWSGTLNLVFSEEWEGLGLYIILASPMLVSRFVSSSIGGFGVLGYGKIGLIIQGLQFSAMAAALLGAYSVSATDEEAIMALSWALFSVGVIQIIAMFWVAKIIDKISFLETNL